MAGKTTVKEKLFIRGVEITHPDKVLFEEKKITKGEIVMYYDMVAPFMLAEIKNRPLMLLRCPHPERKQCFFQKHFDEKEGPLKTISIKEEEGKKGLYVIVQREQDIIELVQRNTIEFHTWGSHAPHVEIPDRIVFDLDPAPEISFKVVISLAKRFRDFLEKFNLQSFPRLTGGKGLHLVVPLTSRTSWEQVRHTSEALARLFAEEEQLTTLNMLKKKRRGKIFIDYLRNGRGATCIANYSLRARAGAPAAIPLRWEEVTPKLPPQHFLFDTVKKRIQKTPNPWKNYYNIRQSLPKI